MGQIAAGLPLAAPVPKIHAVPARAPRAPRARARARSAPRLDPPRVRRSQSSIAPRVLRGVPRSDAEGCVGCDGNWLGGPGGLLPQGSHGPGRADFPHPVRQFMVSLRDRPSARHERVAEEIPRATDSCAPTSTLFSTIVG